MTRDRSFLLDRLLKYEKPENSESESEDDTESSEDDGSRIENVRKYVNFSICFFFLSEVSKSVNFQ